MRAGAGAPGRAARAQGPAPPVEVSVPPGGCRALRQRAGRPPPRRRLERYRRRSKERTQTPQDPCCPSESSVQPVTLRSLVPAPAHVLAGVLPKE